MLIRGRIIITIHQFGLLFPRSLVRALKAGVKRPLLVLLPDARFENAELVTLLGALEGLYVVSCTK